MRKTGIFFVVLLVLFHLPFVAGAEVETKEEEKECGCPPSLGRAPDFALKDIEGKEVKLSEIEANGIILFFWATWCQRCRAHIPELNKAYAALKEEGVELLGIGVGESARRVKRYERRVPIDFPVLLDTDQKVSQFYVVVGVPTFIILNKDKYIKFQNHFWPHNYRDFVCE